MYCRYIVKNAIEFPMNKTQLCILWNRKRQPLAFENQPGILYSM